LAEIISSDVALLVTFNQAIEGVIRNNQKARQNPNMNFLDGQRRPACFRNKESASKVRRPVQGWSRGREQGRITRARPKIGWFCALSKICLGDIAIGVTIDRLS
jgi:hypothetical protein